MTDMLEEDQGGRQSQREMGNPSSVASFAIAFSHSEDCLFILLIVSFVVKKLLSLISGEESRWRRNRTGRSLSLLQIH